MIPELAPTNDLVEQPTMREKVDELKDCMMELPQYEPITHHHFHGGMYCREVFRHAGVLIVGKVHKKEHFYFVVFGTVSITTDDGVITVTGPHLFKSMPGTRRAVLAETDALCVTFHATEFDTVEAAEELVEPEQSHFTIGNILNNKQIKADL